ncbi:hypothetical protein ATI61_102343 [Archangium gephyra]|uniref:C2 domain-containing protein n=1 Tax=Archangium gephyra TaxID=48 RepID=A0ABX9K8I6_9BACT|nr:hypothetical protein ATI61_102343 [Archangium gephyra]
MGGVCQDGDTVGGCGRGGAECKQCGTGFICAADQQCTAQSSCDVSTCPGCCFNGTCVTAPTAVACGAHGALCKQCGPNTVCDAGECVPDAAIKWRVSAILAEVNPQDTSGNDWDIADGSAPDVYVALSCPPASAPNIVSTPAVEAYAPQWTSDGCTSTFGSLTKEPVSVTVYDYDPFTPTNDLVANFTMQLSAVHLSDQLEFTLPPTQGLKSLTFRVTRVGK